MLYLRHCYDCGPSEDSGLRLAAPVALWNGVK